MTTSTGNNVDRYRQLVEAFNRHAADRGAHAYHGDAQVTDHGQQQTLSGREQIRVDYWQGWFDASSDQRLEDLEILAAGEWTVARGVIRGTHDGAWAGLAPTGRQFAVSVCDLVRWRDGQVVEEHLYYDQHTILAQLGAAPAPAGTPR